MDMAGRFPRHNDVPRSAGQLLGGRCLLLDEQQVALAILKIHACVPFLPIGGARWGIDSPAPWPMCSHVALEFTLACLTTWGLPVSANSPLLCGLAAEEAQPS